MAAPSHDVPLTQDIPPMAMAAQTVEVAKRGYAASATLKQVVPGLFPKGLRLWSRGRNSAKVGCNSKSGRRSLSVIVCSSIPSSRTSQRTETCCVSIWEDGENRVQRRMTKYFGARRQTWPECMRLRGRGDVSIGGGLEDPRNGPARNGIHFCKRPAFVSVPRPLAAMRRARNAS